MSNSSLAGPHDSRECGYNYRKHRFDTPKFTFNPNSNGCSLPYKTDESGVLPGFNGQVSLKDGEMTIKLYTDDHTTGLYSHDVIALTRSIVASLQPAPEHEAMISLLLVCNLLKDKVGVRTSNNFSESPMERDSPPDPSLTPTREQWNAIYDMLISTSSDS
jgi:hypothetical protein